MYTIARTFTKPQLFTSTLRNSLRTYVAVGDRLPSINVFEGSPGNAINLAEETKSGKTIVIGAPGAFSPACNSTHIPGYVKHLRAFNDKGYQKFFVVSVNDPFVTKNWGEYLLHHTVAGHQIRFMADPAGEFTNELGLLFDAKKFFGNDRSKRYALVLEDGVITKAFIEPDNTSVDVSEATKIKGGESIMIIYRIPSYSRCISIWRHPRVFPVIRFNSTTTEFTEQEIETSKKWLEKFTYSQIPTQVFDISYSRSSGAGGQKVNKTSSKATVSLEPGQWLTPATCYWIPKPIQDQLKENKIRYETKSGGLLIQSDASRNRDVNSEECFKKLLEEIKLKVFFPGEVSEEDKLKWEKLEKVSKERRKLQKKMNSDKKKNRSKNFDW